MISRRVTGALGAAILTLAATMPAALSAAPRILVTSQDDGSVSEIDTQANRVLSRTEVGPGPAGIGSAETCDRVAVTHPDFKAVDLIDMRTRRIRKLDYAGEPFGVVADHDAVYVTDWSKDRVVRLDARSGRETGVTAVGKSPAGMVLDRTAHRLYVADRESGGISVVDASAMRTIASVPTGKGPFALTVAPNGRRVYVANVRSNDLTVVDTASLSSVASIKAGAMPYGVAVTADNRTVLVTNQHGNTLSVVEAAGLRVVATIPVGKYPEGVVVVGDRAYVANWFSGDVSVVDLAQRREVARIKVGEGPRYLAALHDAGGRC